VSDEAAVGKGRGAGASAGRKPRARHIALGLLAALTLTLPVALAGCGSAATATADVSTTPSPSPSAAHFQSSTYMKTVGIIGGISWASTATYYRLLNEWALGRFGTDYSVPILMYSIPFGDFAKQERLADKGDWKPLDATMVDAAKRLEAGGADFIIIASNTMNSTGDLIEQNVSIPVMRIEDCVGRDVKERGLTTVALLGTKYTMEEPFYRERLKKYGFKVVIPNLKERDYINATIFDRLCNDTILPEDRRHFQRIIARLVKEEGAQGVILGCTEIPLLIKQRDVSVHTFDSTALHVYEAFSYACGDQGALVP
jgi:aspartate racemase